MNLPAYMPEEAHVVTSYGEVLEILTTPPLRPEPPLRAEPISGGVLTMTHAAEHTTRRRIMNRLVRPDALEHYREVLLLPALRRQMERLRDSGADPDGLYRTDLVEFVMLPFVSFAAALAGFDMTAPGREERLLELINDMGAHHRIKWFSEDQCPAIIDKGRKAKEQFKSEYFSPALGACPYQPGQEVPREEHDLISLVAAELDPAWHDQDLKVRETFTSIFAAGVGSSATMMTNTLEELSRWLPDHPEATGKLDDLSFLSRVLQETLRLNPTPPVFGRVADEDVELSTGRRVQAGDWICLFPKEANRDPEYFGEDAEEFNPDRELPQKIPRYGVSFGAGSHQCLGLRVVLGNDGVGSHAHVLRMLLTAGVEPDPEGQPRQEPSERQHYAEYPVVFTNLEGALASAI